MGAENEIDNKNKNENNENVKPYKRETLKRIPTSKNIIINFKETNILSIVFGDDKIKEFFTPNLEFLYFSFYCCESVKDSGWGCAWRSMQSLLKYQLSVSNQNKDHDISFYNLFMKYGDKNTLLEIYKKMKNDENSLNILKKKTFAPHETESGWAEPFISQLVLFSFGFEGELILINGYSEHNYAPKVVFNNKILNFNEFKMMLINHFIEKNNPGPIIIDDSYSSLSIIGIKINNEKNEASSNLELLIMDPHTIDHPEFGLYIVILNNKGRQVGVLPNQSLCSKSVDFSVKPWMAYIPNEIK